MSQRDIAGVLGKDQATVSPDANVSEETLFPEETRDDRDAHASVMKAGSKYIPPRPTNGPMALAIRTCTARHVSAMRS
jgi:hypothetical protein